MRNMLLISGVLCLIFDVVVAQNQMKNLKSIDNDSISIHTNSLKRVVDFDFIIEQKSWRYSTFDSTFVDYSNAKIDTTRFEGEIFVQTKPLIVKITFTNTEKEKLYLISEKVNFDLLPECVFLKNIYYNRDEIKRNIKIFHNNINHAVEWGSLYPDVGNNKYVVEHRKLVNRYRKLNDTICMLLSNKLEKLYLENHKRKNPIRVQGYKLSDIKFPPKYIPKIGKITWGIICT